MDGRQRLDSWKEIAGYLARDVRTAQRWEQELGLPVHRAGQPGRPSVFAFVDELDAWLLEREAPGEPARPGPGLRVWLVGGGLILAFLVVLALVWGRMREGSIEISADDWILILPFENRTSDPRLTGLLEPSFERHLINGGHSRIVSQARIQDAMGRLGLSGHQKLDLSLARRVARVDEGIRLLLAGEWTGDGEQTRLEIRLIEASSGRTIRQATHPFFGLNPERGVIRAADWLGRELFGVIGTEPVISEADVIGQRFSPRAVNLYNLGLTALHREDRPVAEQFFRDALAEDPEFPSAYIYLAWVERSRAMNAPDPSAGPDFLATASRALELAGKAPDAERYFILASHAHLNGDFEKAIPYYEALLLVAPDHFWGNRNLLFLSEQTADWVRAVELSYQLHEMRPWDPLSNFIAARAAAAWAGDFERARRYVDRIKQVEQARPHGTYDGWISNFELFDAWYHDDLEQLQTRLQDLTSRALSAEGGLLLDLVRIGGDWHMALGQFKAAERLFQLVRGEHQHLLMMTSSFLKGDHKGLAVQAEKFWSSSPTRALGTAMILSAHAGLREEVETVAEEFAANPTDRSPNKAASLFGGAAAAVRGDLDTAFRKLEEGLVGDPGEPRWLIGWLLLVDLLVKEGRYEEAIQQLQRVPRSFVFPSGAPYWVMSRVKLLDLVEKSREGPPREPILRQLEGLLAAADPEFRAFLRHR